ncbi:hypothetical protein ACH4MA_03650 [Streptomyces roseolus]|uniref:hypothetical protein n=1 Tax=Streptomyces roseolus TaxID=67358 RepID=UPI0037B9D3D8
MGEELGLEVGWRGKLEPPRAKSTKLADRGWLHKRPDGRFAARRQPYRDRERQGITAGSPAAVEFGVKKNNPHAEGPDGLVRTARLPLSSATLNYLAARAPRLHLKNRRVLGKVRTDPNSRSPAACGQLGRRCRSGGWSIWPAG